MDTMMNDDELSLLSLRERSLRPGGFGEDRTRIWPALLGVQPLSDPPPYSEVNHETVDQITESIDDDCAEEDPHADERQIKLDTDRSFVLYPVESSATSARDALQSDLHALVVSLFRKRRALHYFQGFHDIITVLFLTLPQPLHLACAEKMALHRVRDAMGVGLEPILGLLRVLRNLLRLVDPEYAELLENISPLPYHALPHLLTLFSHDLPTLPLVQHVWDFLLSREPIAVVWLVAALVLHRKSSVYSLAEQDEEGMIHSLLGRLPELVDAEIDSSDIEAVDGEDLTRNGRSEVEVDPTLEDRMVAGSAGARSSLDGDAHLYPDISAQKNPGDRVVAQDGTHIACDTFAAAHTGHGDGGGELETNEMDEGGYDLENPNPPLLDEDRPHSEGSRSSSTPTWASGSTDKDAASVLLRESSTLGPPAFSTLPDSRSLSPPHSPKHPSLQSTLPLQEDATVVDSPDPSAPNFHSLSSSSSLSSRSRTQSRSSSSHSTCSSSLEQSSTTPNPFASHSPQGSFPPSQSKSRSKPVPLSLPHLLRRADALLTAYSPSHPLIRVSEIMGPDSAMRTWHAPRISTEADNEVETAPSNQTDDYLESLANSSHIVIPSPPPSPLATPRLPEKKLRAPTRSAGQGLLNPRRIGLRLGALTPAERRVLLVGALFVVGAAIALKAVKVPGASGLVKASGGDALKRLWHGKWSLISSAVAAWGRGLP
ncbi:hypothetical protein BS17DRAFT_777520 [Gyrodon lividus]|nr:hypothetical protein BS17DRAFT_777520 [Gyrodon lividus]